MAIPGNFLSSTTESIEPNTSGWRAKLNCTLHLGTGGRNGPNVLEVKSVAAGETQAETVTAYPVIGGETYYVFADAASLAVGERIGILWLNESGTAISTTWSMTTASASGSLHRVSVAGAAPPDAATARVVLSANETAAGALHHWENVYFGLPIRTQGNLLPFNVESGGELSSSGWVAETNATVARTAPMVIWPVNWYLSGGHLIAMTVTANGNAAMRCTQRVAATPGMEYLAYSYLGPRSSGMQPWVELRFYDAGGTLLLAKRANLAPPGVGLYRQHVSGTAPAGTETCEIATGLTAATAGQQLWVEGVVIAVAPKLRAGSVVPYEDSTFEAGVGSWAVASGTGTLARTSPWRATTEMMHGSYAMLVSAASTGATVVRSGAYPVTPGVSWRPEFSIKHVAGGWTVDIGARWLDSGGTEIGTDGLTGALALPTDGAWWTFFDDMTPPPGTASARIDLHLTATAASSTAWVDKVTLREVLPSTEVVADDDLARITLTLRDLIDGRLMTLWRVDEAGLRTLVRGPDGLMQDVAVSSDMMIVEDYEAPLGRPVSYYVEFVNASTGAYAGGRTTDTATINPGDGNLIWLKDPGMPHRNIRLRAHKPPDWARSIETGEYRIRGRRNPVVHSEVRAGLRGTLSVWTEDDEQREALHWILDSGNTLLWQAAPGHGVADMYVAVGEVTEARRIADARDTYRLWDLPLTEVDMPAAVGVAGTAGRSWQDVLSENTSWQEVLDRYATWEDVLLGRPISEE
ncbi:hypothetical protein [Streptomyces sp. DH37]|uniref:hypothetical protein n=1 Tax=Streptomyces sp. DH37 TaxID=3040122 RepID=UPI0024412895|nr:hypothetical protein [Streptomyces sp. DH37]MDG9703821.1 hypothetical protein [Streptomyces sp. DH37]